MEGHELEGHLVAADLVDFGDDSHERGFGGDFAHVVEDPSVAGADFFVRGDGDGDEIHVGVGVFDYFVEPFPQEGAGPVQAGRVHHDDLGVVAVDDAADGVPGGFRLVGGDGDFLPHQGVCQC